MKGTTPTTLGQALDFKLSNLLRCDLLIGICGGAGGVWVALADYERFKEILPLAVGLVGIVVGTVIAGVAILAAFLNQPFLRKLKAINREPIRYVRPFLFTALLGIIASILTLAVAALPVNPPSWIKAAGAGLLGTSVVWMLASVVPNLGMLVQFIGLQFDAADVPDEAEYEPSERRRQKRD